MPVEEEIIILYAVTNNYLEDVAIEKILVFEKEFLRYVNKYHKDLITQLSSKQNITPELEEKIKNAIGRFKKENLQFL